MKRNLLLILFFVALGNLNAQNSITNITGESFPGACDGTVRFQFSTPAFGETVAILAEAPGLAPFLDTLSVQEGDTIANVQFTGLCNGSYAIMTTDTMHSAHFDTLYFNITQGDSLVLTTSSTNETAQGACDGTAIVTAFGGSGPVSYTLIDQDSNFVGSGSNYSNLCPGLYIAAATDSAGNSVSQSFLVVDATSIFGPPNIQDSVFIDTLSNSAIQACNINLTDVIDIQLGNYSLTSGGDSIIVYWMIQTVDTTLSLVQVYYFDSTITTGNLYVTVDLYCPVTKSLSGAVKGQGVLNFSFLGISSLLQEEVKFQLYPNPVSTSLHVELADSKKFDLIVYDVSGKTVYNKSNLVKSEDINVSELRKGVYFLQVITEETKFTKRFIKE